MKRSQTLLQTMLLALVLCALVNGTPVSAAGQSDPAREGESPYVVLDESLGPLKERFNAGLGKVRQLFIVGPTCGICLRGMADLNDEYIAELQGDERLQTLVVHVPTLGAREEHVAPTIPLLDGPNVTHYWDSTGIIGRHYQELLGARMYLWDVWFIYGPEASWSGRLPPPPKFYQHQLAGFDLVDVLDKEEFAAVALDTLAQIPKATLADEIESQRGNLLADGTFISKIAQPRGVAVEQHIRGRGGYKRLKQIQSITYQGKIEVAGSSFPLTIKTDRSNRLERIIGFHGATSRAVFQLDQVAVEGASENRGLDWMLEMQLFGDYDFDGMLVEWPDKGHELTMNGMRKAGDVLAWELDVTEQSGRRWRLLLNSHKGDIVQATLTDQSGKPQIVLEADDYRDAEGTRLAYRRIYRQPDGQVLAIETIEHVSLDMNPEE